jgi:hypothetical protein
MKIRQENEDSLIEEVSKSIFRQTKEAGVKKGMRKNVDELAQKIGGYDSDMFLVKENVPD